MRRLLIALLTLPVMNLYADTVINRCVQDDGTVAFQETPCAKSKDDHDDQAGDDQSNEGPATPADDFFDFRNPFDESSEPLVPSAPEPVQTPSLDRAECEKVTRDAIDEIDFAMRKGYTEDEGKQYLAELLDLTKQLRACKLL